MSPRLLSSGFSCAFCSTDGCTVTPTTSVGLLRLIGGLLARFTRTDPPLCGLRNTSRLALVPAVR